VLVEHARNLLGIDDALHAEYGDRDGTAIVTLLEQLTSTRSEPHPLFTAFVAAACRVPQR